MPDLLPRMAQFELTLLDWAEQHKGPVKYVAFANKCWPAFPTQFGFVPCYVNSRLTGTRHPRVLRGGHLRRAVRVHRHVRVRRRRSPCSTSTTPCPRDMYDEDIKGKYDYRLTETFMGFHCGNTPAASCCKTAR